MAHPHDAVLESTTTTGTGTVTLAGAVTGARTVASAFAVGEVNIPYSIRAVDANGNATGDFESGWGTLVTATTFSRDTVSESSNAGALVNFAAGTKYLSVTALSDQLVLLGRAVAAQQGMLMM